MRCPKCQYISFESSERCRNCGYEFSLALDQESVDVRIARDEPASSRRREGAFSALDTPLNPPSERGVGRSPLAAADLPLFTDRIADDQAPLVAPPAVPRAPLSVRKPAPVRPRQSPLPEELSLDLEADDDDVVPEGLAAFGVTPVSLAHAHASADGAVASLGRRTVAGVIDVLILGAIATAVVLLTLRVCELTVEQWRTLPAVPMLAFILLLCGGYFVLFTAAGGQTIGKMAAGIRVVNSPGATTARVSFKSAVVRAVACLGSVLPLGAGFLLAVANDDRCAFHDRVAETRVVAA